MSAHRLDQPPVLKQCRLVLDVIARDPCLDLISESLQLLDLRFQVRLQLLFLRHVCRRLHLVVYRLKKLDALRNLLQGSVNFRCTPQRIISVCFLINALYERVSLRTL